jgi:hypothetical protein
VPVSLTFILEHSKVMCAEEKPGNDTEETHHSSTNDRNEAWLKREAAIGYAQLKAGQTVTVRSKAEFFAILRGKL